MEELGPELTFREALAKLDALTTFSGNVEARLADEVRRVRVELVDFAKANGTYRQAVD
jgi:hypothetical protein